MVAWEPMQAPGQPPAIRDYQEIWKASDKIVYSRTLQKASSARTRIERDFDPEAVRRLKAAAERDISVGGADLDTQAINAGLVDQYHLLIAPVVVGGGTASLPTNVHLQL